MAPHNLKKLHSLHKIPTSLNWCYTHMTTNHIQLFSDQYEFWQGFSFALSRYLCSFCQKFIWRVQLRKIIDVQEKKKSPIKSIYLAGPDVFRPNPFEIANKKKEILAKYGLVGHFPMDNEIDSNFHKDLNKNQRVEKYVFIKSI